MFIFYSVYLHWFGLPFFLALFNSYFLLLFLISLFGTYTFDFSKLSPLARKEAGYLIYEPAGCRINPFYFICFFPPISFLFIFSCLKARMSIDYTSGLPLENLTLYYTLPPEMSIYVQMAIDTTRNQN